MFSLTVLDHVRLDSEQAARNYMVHAAAADRLARVLFGTRIAMVVLLAAATSTAVAALAYPDRVYQTATVVATLLATLGFALYAVLGFETRVAAHRALARRLWLVAERYRSLLSEAGEGLIDTTAVIERRDALTAELHAVYESGFAVDQRAFESGRLPALPDERAA